MLAVGLSLPGQARPADFAWALMAACVVVHAAGLTLRGGKLPCLRTNRYS